jgi:hypothetical protein
LAWACAVAVGADHGPRLGAVSRSTLRVSLHVQRLLMVELQVALEPAEVDLALRQEARERRIILKM